MIDATADSELSIRGIRDIKEEAEDMCGGVLAKPELGDKVVAVVEWIDGTILDSIWQVSDK